MSRLRLIQLSALALVVLPCLAVSLRISVLEQFAHLIHASILSPSQMSDVACDNRACIKQYKFNIPPPGGGSESQRVGFYNTFLSGVISQEEKLAPSYYEEFIETPPNWYQFQDFNVRSAGPFWVTAIAPAGRKKIGMDWPKVFFGTPDQIAALSTVHALFNTQLYIALSVITLVLALVLRVGMVRDRNSFDYRYTLITGLLVSCVCLAYSHLFDHLAFQMGLSLGSIENVSKWLWGPALCFLSLKSNWRALIASLVYLVAIGWFGGFGNTTPATFHTAYPLIVAAVALFVVISNRRDLTDFQLPTVLCVGTVIYDGLVVNGIVPLVTSSYLSPLAMTGLFAWIHRDGLRAILNLAFFGHKQELINVQLEALSKTRDQLSSDLFLTEIAGILSAGLDANRASILILESGKPLIANYKGGKIEIIRDGYTPPVFARVLQTNEELFLVEGADLKTIRERAPDFSRKSLKYSGCKSVVMPIASGQTCYGALAITDFANERDLMADPHYQEHLRGMIAVIRSEVLKWVMRDASEQSSASRKVEQEIISDLLSRAPSLRTSSDTMEAFCQILKLRTGLSAAYFSFDEKTEAATYIASHGLTERAKNLWGAASFYAKKDNNLSPIAIAINEKRPVFIEDITSFYGFLKSKSVQALDASDARGLIVLPVEGFQQRYGVLLIFQPRAQADTRSINEFRFLERFGELLAIQAYQSEINAKSEHQERTLRRIIDPELIDTVMSKENDHSQVVGRVEDSLIFVLDFRGSTQASRGIDDPSDLAQRLSKVYDAADKIVRRYGGYFEKGNGDGLLFTLKCTPSASSIAHLLFGDLFNHLQAVASRELGLRKSIVVAHRGQLFRGVLGTAGRMAWDNCGKELVNTFDIEKHAKQIGGVVLAISSAFCTSMEPSVSNAIQNCASQVILLEAMNEEIYVFNSQACESLIVSFRSPETHIAIAA